MEKKQVDYKQFEKERIISVSDLIEAVLRKIWLIIILAVIFAVSIGGYKYMQDRAALDVASSFSTEEAETSVSDEEMQQVIRLKTQLEEQEQYMENSILMKINPYMEDRVCIQMIVQTQEENVSNVLNALEFYVTDGALAADLQQKYPDIQEHYLNELISFERSTDIVKLTQNETAEFDRGSVFSIKIVQEDNEACEALAVDVQEYIQKYKEQSAEALGAYDVAVLDVSAATVIDHSLLSYQSEKTDSLETLRNTLADKESALSDGQRQILNQHMSEGNADNVADNTENTAAVSINKKYVVIGAGVGIIIGIIVVILHYIIRGTLNLALEFPKMFNIRVFGQVDLFEKENIFVTVWRRFLNRRKKLSVEEEQHLVVSNIQSYCKQNQITEVLFAGSEKLHGIPWVRELIEILAKDGIRVALADEFPYSSDVMDGEQADEVIIFIEILHVSRYEDVLNSVKKCLEQGRQIGGAIVLN